MSDYSGVVSSDSTTVTLKQERYEQLLAIEAEAAKRSEEGRWLTIGEFRYLVAADAKLIALENAGVDSWDGYSHAMEAHGSNDEGV